MCVDNRIGACDGCSVRRGATDDGGVVIASGFLSEVI